jgi:hypothetical protein
MCEYKFLLQYILIINSNTMKIFAVTICAVVLATKTKAANIVVDVDMVEMDESDVADIIVDIDITELDEFDMNGALLDRYAISMNTYSGTHHTYFFQNYCLPILW